MSGDGASGDGANGDGASGDGATTRVDPHVKVLDESVVARAKAAGLDAVVYAPHFTRLPTIRERAERFSDDDLLVVPGREVFTGTWRERKHLLAVGLDEPVPDFVTLAAVVEETARQEAAALVPHPAYLSVGLSGEDLDRHADRIHGVETYNPKHLSRHNRRARKLAADFDLPAFGSSYAHLRGTVGEVWTVLDRAVESEADLVAALRDRGVDRRVVRRSGTAHGLRRLAEVAHLGYENTWKKADRVLLSGMEPTHPHHIAYDGRFDASAVY